jgi:hypothetical protein
MRNVTSNEPEDGTNDGHTAQDWMITGQRSASA